VSRVGYTTETNGTLSPGAAVPKALRSLAQPGAATFSASPPGVNPTPVGIGPAVIPGGREIGVRPGSPIPVGGPKENIAEGESGSAIPDIVTVTGGLTRSKMTDEISSGPTASRPPDGHRATLAPEAIGIERRRDRGHFTRHRATTRPNRADHRRRRRKQRVLGRMRYVRSPQSGRRGHRHPEEFLRERRWSRQHYWRMTSIRSTVTRYSRLPNSTTTWSRCMAKETVTRLVDDLDGGVAHETVKFGLDGHQYEIDLSSKNAKKLRSELAMFVERGSRVSTRTVSTASRGRGARTGAASADQNRAIREWAQSKGYEVAERGRIKQEIVEAFHQTAGR